MRERENLFNDYQDELRRKEKDEKHQKKEQVRDLKEHACVKFHAITNCVKLHFPASFIVFSIVFFF